LQAIIDSSRDWIWECDREGRFTFSSPSVREILGYGHHEILGRSAETFVDAADAEQLRASLGVREPNAHDAPAVTLRWRHRSGKTRWLERSTVALRDDDGQFVGVRGIDRDVTIRRSQEARIRRLNRALRFLSGASSAVMRLRDRGQLLNESCRLAVSVGGYSRAMLHLLPSDDDAQPLTACHGEGAQAELDARTAAGESTAVGRALTSGAPEITADIAAATDEQLPAAVRARALADGLRSCIALPLSVDGTAVGALELYSDEVGVFGDAELALLKQVAANVAFALQYLHSKESAEYFEYFDPLTSLANRSLYRPRLAAALVDARRQRRRVALVVLDIADFSIVNDGLGHHAGDLELQLVAERLKNEFRDTNALCRLAGDRFAVMVASAGAEAAPHLQQRVAALFDEPFAILDRELRVAIRAGLAQSPEDGTDADALLQHATTALQQAKQAGAPYLRHSPAMSASASERLRVVSELRRAVAARAFELHYQPKVELATGRLQGVEALLRWPSAPPTAAAPSAFVPLLESLGLIEDVGGWVIEHALAESQRWFAGRAEFRVAVNVSPLQLQRDSFADRVLGLAGSVPGGARRLELEITESTLMVDPERAGASLARLRSAGVSIAIDDFGTGHSSLRVLAGMPVDVLKIDRSFVRALATSRSDRSIVQATIMLARSLGLYTVAEGVENAAQVDALRELGCDAIQGFLVRRPGVADELSRWLEAVDERSVTALLAARAPVDATGDVHAAPRKAPPSRSS
jgi:diguanylate cyclase (GGDEF)-like protein/PAS domain S-box-containing protein